MDNEISILLVDDHAIVRNGIKAMLSSEQDFEIIGEGSDGNEAISMILQHHPDIVIMDINMPNLNGLDALKKLREKGDHTPCLILSMHESEEYVMKALDFGADGYILKDTSKDHFLKAIRSVAGGGKYFSGAVSEYIVARLLNTTPKNTVNSTDSSNDAELHSEEIDELTKREKQILDLVTDGLSNKEIADKLNKSVRTIEAHRFNLMKKLDAKNLAELIFKAGKK